MKQTVEEAAKSFANKKWPDLKNDRQAHVREYAKNDFKAGAEWAASLPNNPMPGWISVEQRLPTKDDTCDEYYNEVLTIQAGRNRPTFMKFWEIEHCPFTKWWMKITPPESAPTEK